MKKLSLLLIIMTIFFAACEKDKENIVIKGSITPNDLSNLSSSSFVLTRDDAANTFQTFKWTQVDYGFTAVITYVLQFDKTSDDFASPVDLVTVTHDTTVAVTIGDLNKLMLAAGMNPDEPVDLQFRVKATINPAVDPVFSTLAEATVTPYATSFPPIYMCGQATGGWAWDLYVYKELRSTAPNIYETIGYFVNSGSDATFRFFKDIGWGADSYNYPYFTGTVSDMFENAADGDLNFRFIGVTGYYKITVNMTTKSVAMEAVAEPVLYATGGALGGWDWTTNYIQLTWKSNGIFQATTDFTTDIFRFFKQAGWGDGYNYTYFAGGSVTALLELNANDSDNNFKFVGTPGSYKITVNLLDLIVTMDPAK
jgi:hypothetical protein